uniref:Inner centromere protein ARK-binding domain-containing protein n=1 Tax=Graphocephala atropunctata TaxID=36148 RepID=A0A1B6MUS3_9HEMI
MKGTMYLKSKFKEPINDVRKIMLEYTSTFEDTIEDLEFILYCVQNDLIKIKPKGSEKAVDSAANGKINAKDIQEAVGTDNGDLNDEVFKVPGAGQKKKRGRPKQSAAAGAAATDAKTQSESTESCSLDDSISSNTSTKSQRAAAQAAGQKMVQVHSFMKAKKLRRPTDFDKKQAKCRKTRQNQSAGSSASSSELGDDQVEHENVAINEQVANGHKVQVCEVTLERMNSPTIKLYTKNQGKSSDTSSREDKESPVVTENEMDGEQVDGRGIQNCEVALKRINTPTIKSLTQNRAQSKSLERTSRKRTSADLFNDSDPLVQPTKQPKDKQPDPSVNSKQNRNRAVKGNLTIGVNVNENKDEHLRKRFRSGTGLNENQVEPEAEVVPMAHSSPVVCDSPTINEVFNGFDLETVNKTTVKTFVKQEPDDGVTENLESIIMKTESQTDDKKSAKSRKALKKVKNHVEIENKENTNHNNATITLGDELNESSDDSGNTRSRTRIHKKIEQTEIEDNKQDNESNRDNKNRTITIAQEQDQSPNTRSRTRVIRADESAAKARSDDDEIKDEVVDDSAEANARSRTRTLKKNTVDSNEEENNVKSRTRVIKKAVQADSVEENNAKYLASEFKETEDVRKQNNKLVPEVPKSPAPKGELVKKRVENFEKLKNGEEVVEDKPSRVTRNAAKNKTASSATADSKVTRNVPFNKLLGSASKQQMTPDLESRSRFQVINKFPHSANRSTPAESNKVILYKQSAEESEKRKKEEERMKRKVKEEDAMKKKEKTLKATSDETRRKREEKLLRVAAVREAAEREKALLAAKLEKEKEDKMRLIAAEREKQKEEHMKKKLLMQQKTLEHEERRRQEEAARLAKIKEQEEEHRRILAMKEREQELLQKAAELRLAEAEKAKQPGPGTSKLGKLAAVNNAKMKIQLGMTPSEKTNSVQPTQSYEITPSREERPVLKSKTETDYGLDDAKTDDSSDDEGCPKKQIPKWALPKNRQHLIKVTRYTPSAVWDLFMEPNLNPDLNKMFAGTIIRKRVRTSSAVWKTPPKMF